MAGRPITRKPDPRQQTLPLSEPAFIERLQLLDAIALERSGLSRAAWSNVVALLKAVAKAGDECWASIAWLSDKSGLPKRTLHRARTQSLELGLLAVDPRYNQHGRTTSIWRVDWLAVAKLDRRRSKPAKPTPPACPAGECHCGSGECHSGTGECHFGTGNLLTNLLNQSSTATERVSCAEVDAWDAVVVEVFDCGVNQARAACAAARQRKAAPADVLAVVEFWRLRRSAWKFPEAELKRRIERITPGEPPSDRWGPARRGYRDPVEIRNQNQRREAKLLQRRLEAQQLAAEPPIDVLAEYRQLLRNRGASNVP